MKPKFTVYMDLAGEYRWRFTAVNNQIMADSGESYTREYDCKLALKTFIALVIEIERGKGRKLKLPDTTGG